MCDLPIVPTVITRNSQNTRRLSIFPLAHCVAGKIGQTCFNCEMVKDYLECVLLITVGISSHQMMLSYIKDWSTIHYGKLTQKIQ